MKHALLCTQPLPVLHAAQLQLRALSELYQTARTALVETDMRLFRNLAGRKRLSTNLINRFQQELDDHGLVVLTGCLARRQDHRLTIAPRSAVISLTSEPLPPTTETRSKQRSHLDPGSRQHNEHSAQLSSPTTNPCSPTHDPHPDSTLDAPARYSDPTSPPDRQSPTPPQLSWWRRLFVLAALAVLTIASSSQRDDPGMTSTALSLPLLSAPSPRCNRTLTADPIFDNLRSSIEHSGLGFFTDSRSLRSQASSLVCNRNHQSRFESASGRHHAPTRPQPRRSTRVIASASMGLERDAPGEQPRHSQWRRPLRRLAATRLA